MCGCDENVTDLRIGICICCAEGQLALGMTGGKTDNKSNGNPPVMLKR